MRAETEGGEIEYIGSGRENECGETLYAIAMIVMWLCCQWSAYLINSSRMRSEGYTVCLRTTVLNVALNVFLWSCTRNMLHA